MVWQVPQYCAPHLSNLGDLRHFLSWCGSLYHPREKCPQNKDFYKKFSNMTANDYRSDGYAVSAQLEQSVIDRAEHIVIDAYVLPIIPEPDLTNCDVRSAVMALAFLYMNKRQGTATRSGVRTKTLPSSTETRQENVIQSMAMECDAKLKALRAMQGANACAQIRDVCQIYYRSNYFYTR